MVDYTPKRGDIIWLEFDPQTGKEIKKSRPALTISPYQYNVKTNLGLFMPITSQVKGYPFEVLIEEKEIQGAVLCDQIRSLDWKARKARFILHLPDIITKDVLNKLYVLLSFEPIK